MGWEKPLFPQPTKAESDKAMGQLKLIEKEAIVEIELVPPPSDDGSPLPFESFPFLFGG